MRDIPLPNGVVIFDGCGLFGSPPTTGAKLDGLVIVSPKADGRDEGKVVTGVDEVVSSADEVLVGVGGLVAGVGGVVAGVGGVV